MKHKRFNRLLSMLLVVATLFGMMALPANAASLGNSGTVTIQQAGYGNYLSRTSGGTIGGGYWKYTSNDGLTGTAYCVNHGLKGVSPSKALTVQEYNRNPQTMGAFANGYPNRTLEQFKELHADDVRGIANLTEDEYKYATQAAVWATCGQLAVPGTSFTAGRETLAVPTSDAQKIRVFDSVKAILRLANGWTKYLYTGMYLRAEENQDVRGVEVVNEYGLEGAAANGEDGIKKETISGKQYYTRVMYVASATSTWIDGRTTKVYSTDAPELQRKNALSKWYQKQKIKRKYAQAAREAQKTAQQTQNVLTTTGKIARAVAQTVSAHRTALVFIALLALVIMLFSTGLSSCTAMLSGLQSTYISAAYLANEQDICNSDLYYTELETDLQIDINDTEAECRRRITAILETIEGGGAEYLEYLDEYIQDYQERYAGDGGSC